MVGEFAAAYPGDVRQRLLRGATWAAFAGAGILIGLLAGARLADVSGDSAIAVRSAVLAALIGAIAGAAWPTRSIPRSETAPTAAPPAAPASAAAPVSELDLTDTVDLRERPVRKRAPRTAPRAAPRRAATPPRRGGE
jgi:hypothetical protein